MLTICLFRFNAKTTEPIELKTNMTIVFQNSVEQIISSLANRCLDSFWIVIRPKDMPNAESFSNFLLDVKWRVFSFHAKNKNNDSVLPMPIKRMFCSQHKPSTYKIIRYRDLPNAGQPRDLVFPMCWRSPQVLPASLTSSVLNAH